MNNKLIDQYLVDLLKTPAEQRTKSAVAEAIYRLGTAAEIETFPSETLQQEQTKLAAIAQLLAAELGLKYYTVSLSLQETNHEPWSKPLYIYMWNKTDDGGLIGLGRTAEECLRDLNPTVARQAAA
ncbi:hypothetical protein [Pseudomonas chlororaphis]|uniref:hypothetical protein n=1 Tax=Pseudomonas chlororaphis TaxID=587753 RepID=UPI003C1B6F51